MLTCVIEPHFEPGTLRLFDTTREEMTAKFTDSSAFDPQSPSLFVELLSNLAKYRNTSIGCQSLLHFNTDQLESQALVARYMFLNAMPNRPAMLQMYEQLSKMQCAFRDLLALFKVT